MEKKIISIRLDPEIARKYKIFLAKKGITLQKHVEDFIIMELEKDDQL